jgi:hypothetical protein
MEGLGPRSLFILPAFFSLSVIILFPPLSRTRAIMMLPLLLSLMLLFARYRPGSYELMDYSWGCVMTESFIRILSLTVLSRPEEITRRRGPPIAGRSWFSRLYWSIDLFISARGVGWSWQVKNIPPAPGAGLPRWYEEGRECVWGRRSS